MYVELDNLLSFSMSSVNHFENRGIDIGGKCAYLIGSLVSIGQLFNILFV